MNIHLALIIRKAEVVNRMFDKIRHDTVPCRESYASGDEICADAMRSVLSSTLLWFAYYANEAGNGNPLNHFHPQRFR